MKPLFLFVFFLSVLKATIGQAAPAIKDCEQKPDFLVRTRGAQLPQIEDFPKGVLVARRADYYVESKQSNFKMWGSHSFVTARATIVCGNSAAQAFSFSIYAPTLIDRTIERTTGDSFWQFHMTNEENRLGIWNQKTKLFGQNMSVSEVLQNWDGQVRLYQSGHAEVEILFQKDRGDFSEYLRVQFDIVSSPPK